MENSYCNDSSIEKITNEINQSIIFQLAIKYDGYGNSRKRVLF